MNRRQDSQDHSDDPRLKEIDAEMRRVVRRNQQLELEALEHEWELPPITVLPWSARPELYLQVMIWVEICRLLLFGLIEKFGTTAAYLGIGADVLFGAAALWVLGSWTKAEWHANEWLVVPRMTLVVLGLIFAADAVTQGAIWDGHFSPPAEAAVAADTNTAPNAEGVAKNDQSATDQQPDDDQPLMASTIEAGLVSIFFLILAASSYCAHSLFHVQRWLDHPLKMAQKTKGPFRRNKGGSEDDKG